jgi:ADP-dependent NAD(P)H-hydrate dehydratase / NAD(P)H-hydrate epimerase
MLAVVGTVPEQDFPLTIGKVVLNGEFISIDGVRAPVNRGTPALLAAAVKAGEVLGQPAPVGYLVGDIGLGDGSRRLYARLSNASGAINGDISAIAFHYLQPDVDWHNKVLFALQEMARRPVLIADAGFMYAAKMSGQALEYDLFTPDVGELAFLADEEAPHPFYTRGFILHEEMMAPGLIERAYQHENAAACLLVKGQPDYVATREGIHETIDSPVEAAMEPIGGTGDTVTGIVSALIGAGIEVKEAAVLAARVNRLAGHLARPTPATQVMAIVEQIPAALARILKENSILSSKRHA